MGLSIGALKAGKPKLKHASLAEANHVALVDDAKMRFHALFSDGYTAMKAFFDAEYGKKGVRPVLGHKAYRDFRESIAFNNESATRRIDSILRNL